jgi:hypothetical protein
LANLERRLKATWPELACILNLQLLQADVFREGLRCGGGMGLALPENENRPAGLDVLAAVLTADAVHVLTGRGGGIVSAMGRLTFSTLL